MRLLALALLLLGTGCAWFTPPDRFGARPISFTELSGWQEDDHAQALAAFLASCPLLAATPRAATSGSALEIPSQVWQSLCADGRRSQYAAREFFERRFIPYRVNNNGRESGLFTGYYEPVLYGSRVKQGDFIYPLYAPPPELEKSKPYYTHAEINRGALEGRGLAIAWVDDPVMRFFLQIQGSGRLRLTNRKEVSIGYAGGNGHKYVALGKVMADEGYLPKHEINFFTLRQWLYRHPQMAFTMMERNPSYVFFKINDKPGAVGAAGAVLTPQRSLAVDAAHIPYGLPLYLETQLPAQPQQQPVSFRRLVIAQDTGGAIRGPVRGDIFFGLGDEAEYLAGYMANKGSYALLVPREITDQLK